MIDKETYAAVGWATIAEPGDEFAGLLRLSLGAAKSLEFISSQASPHQVLKALERAEVEQAARARFGKLERTTTEALERYLARYKPALIDNAFRASKVFGAKVITPQSEEWPRTLSDLGLAMPAALWLRGETESIHNTVGLVGSRSITRYGQRVAAEFVEILASRGIATVSGGAFGVDIAVHQSALAIDAPTVAVLAGGIDRLYPAGNADVLRKIGLVTELPPGNNPTRWRFLQRNRLIAALGLATVVVEAGWRSGSINTANHALQLGRPLGAVPGQIDEPSSQGTNALIRDGKAQLIAGEDDLLLLAGVVAEPALFEDNQLGVLELRLSDVLTTRFCEIEMLAVRANTTVGETGIALAGLELLGLAERDQGNRWRKRVNL